MQQDKKENKRYINWGGINKTAFGHRWHDCLCRKPERISQKKKTP